MDSQKVISTATNDTKSCETQKNHLSTPNGMLTKPKLRRAFSANTSRPTHKRIRRRSDSSKNISLDILDACASIEKKNDVQKQNKNGNKQKAGRVRRRRNSLRMGLPTQSIDTNDKDHSTSSGSLPCPRRRSRRATLDECTHELKTAADFVSSNNYERVKLLEIAMTPFEVCLLSFRIITRNVSVY